MRSGTARSLLQSRLEKLNDGPVVRFFLFTSGCVEASACDWQIFLDIDDPAHCLVLFKSNRNAGLILFAAMLVDAVV